VQRLALYFDGTWNDEADKTNVFRVFSLAADGPAQKSHYLTGVGNVSGHKIRGGAFGEGLSEHVKAGYDWLRRSYDWAAGEEANQIFIFGFSRGAYTARSLGGLIATCGLARDSTLSTDWLYSRYRDRKSGADPIWKLDFIQRTAERTLTDDEKTLLAHSRRVDIQMLGVWDTVGALGIPWTVPIFNKAKYHFHNPNLSKIYRHAFHALAVDEHRGAFKPTLWTLYQPETDPTPPKIPALEHCEQRWFPGAHSDVGGGCANDLPDAPGRWLQQKAQQLGMTYTALLPTNPAIASATRVSDSYSDFMKGFYKVLKLGRRYYRPIGIQRNAVNGGWSWPVNETLDESVFSHGNGGSGYPPQNLRDWTKATAGQSVAAYEGARIALRST